MIQIVIVDDHPLFREALRAAIGRVYPHFHCGEAGSAGEAWALLQTKPEQSSSPSGESVREQPRSNGRKENGDREPLNAEMDWHDQEMRAAGIKQAAHNWDLVIADSNLPDRSGLELLEEIKCKWPDLPVLLLSEQPDKQQRMRAIKAGAASYLDKRISAKEFAFAVCKILTDGSYICSETSQELVDQLQGGQSTEPHEKLSEREHQVLNRLAQGQSAAAISEDMSLSVNTVRTYRRRILQKLEVESTTDLIRYAMQHGLDQG